MKTTHTPTTTTSTSSADAGDFVIPAMTTITTKLRDAFRQADISAGLDLGNTLELQTEEVGILTCELHLDPCQLHIWAELYLFLTPKNEAQLAGLLIALNEKSIGARFYQDDNYEFLVATDARLIGAEGLNCGTAVEFVRRFISQIEQADKALIAAGFCAEAEYSDETYNEKGDR